MAKVKISVLMPVYNVEKYISAAMESLINQTFQNFEIVVIDDASTDKTIDIIQSYKNFKIPIKILTLSKNSGIAKALNLGLKNCSGEFIVRSDGDDISSPNRLITLLNYFENSNCDLLGSFMTLINENNDVIRKVSLPTNHEVILKVIKYSSPVPHIWICKRSLYDEIGPYNENRSGVEDYDYLLRAIKNGNILGNIPEYLYYVRTRNGNTSTTIGKRSFILAKLSYSEFKKTSLWIDTRILNVILLNVNIAAEFIRRATINKRKFYKSFPLLLIAVVLSPIYSLNIIRDRYYYHKILRNELQK